jgi:ABC-type lipoprotein release transport system permease subunit
MIIGVTAFMVVLSLLQGFNAYVDEKIAGIGSNSFTIRRFSLKISKTPTRLPKRSGAIRI